LVGVFNPQDKFTLMLSGKSPIIKGSSDCSDVYFTSGTGSYASADCRGSHGFILTFM